MRRASGSRGGECGASAVVVALLLAALGGCVALVINVGHLMMVRNQLQNACDAAALAAAREIDGTHGGLQRGRDLAVEFAGRNVTDRNLPVGIDRDADVIYGRWNPLLPKASAFTPISESAPNAAGSVNAVRVLAGRTPARGNPLEVYLPAFSGGVTQGHISAEAIAVHGGPCDNCSVPLVFADCLIVQPDGTLNCGETLVFRSDTTDNVGFTNLEDGVNSVSTSGIIDILDHDCSAVGVGANVGVGNGNNLNNNVIKAFRDYLVRNGNKVTVPVVSPPGGCPAKFNGLQPVVGFATFTILGLTGPPDQSITIRLDCNQVVEAKSVGCTDFGTYSPKPALVR